MVPAAHAWITVDDTGARHRNRNGVTTRIGDDRFTFFKTTFSKSRKNFLKLLRAGYQDYVIVPVYSRIAAKIRHDKPDLRSFAPVGGARYAHAK